MKTRRIVLMALATGLAFTLAWIASAQAFDSSSAHQMREGDASMHNQPLQSTNSSSHVPEISVTSTYTIYLPIGTRNYSKFPLFGYGIVVNPYGDTESNVEHVQTLGMEWVKLWMNWASVEPSRGEYSWSLWDNLIAAYSAPDVNVLLTVVRAPAWSRTGQDLNVGGPPNDPQDLGAFLEAMANRYCGSSVKAIEVWNEQNLHYEWGNLEIDPAAYMNLLKPAYNAIKNACPTMIVVSGAPTPTGAPPPWAMDDFVYFEGMYQNGLKDYSDAVAAHPSGFNVAPWVAGGQDACDFITQQGSIFRGPCNTLHHSWSFYATLNGYYRIMQEYSDGNKKVWSTEFGWAVAEDPANGYEYALDNTYEEQAEWTVEAFRWSRDSGWIGPMFLFNLDFGAIATNSPAAYWSLLRPSGPVPAYYAISNFTK